MRKCPQQQVKVEVWQNISFKTTAHTQAGMRKCPQQVKVEVRQNNVVLVVRPCPHEEYQILRVAWEFKSTFVKYYNYTYGYATRKNIMSLNLYLRKCFKAVGRYSEMNVIKCNK